MRILILSVMLFITGTFNLAQAQRGNKSSAGIVPVYSTFITGTPANIEIPKQGKVFFLGQSFDNAKTGTWYICTDETLKSKIEDITQRGKVAVLVGAELAPYQYFTAKMWRKLPRSEKKKMPKQAFLKLNDVKCVILGSVHEHDPNNDPPLVPAAADPG